MKKEIRGRMALILIEPSKRTTEGRKDCSPPLWRSLLPLHRVDPHEDVVNPPLPPNAGLDYLLMSPESGEMAEVYDYVNGGMRNWNLDSSR